MGPSKFITFFCAGAGLHDLEVGGFEKRSQPIDVISTRPRGMFFPNSNTVKGSDGRLPADEGDLLAFDELRLEPWPAESGVIDQ